MKLRYALALSTSIAVIGSAMAQPGTLDPTFSDDGISVLQPGDLHDVAYDVVALPNNTVLICGVARHNGNNALFVARLRENGGPDPTFGTDQGYTYFNVGEEAYGYAIGINSQNQIYVCGLAYPTFAQSVIILVRTDASGQPDMGFGNNGIVSIPVGANDSEAKGMVVLSDDNVILAGSVVGDDFVRDALLMRVKSDGSVDPDFGVNGFTIADGLTGESLLQDLGVLSDGTIMGVGYTDVDFVMKTLVMQCDPDGLLIPGFGSNGLLLPAIGVNDHAAYGALADGNALLLTGMVANATENDVFVASIKLDGTYDPIFNSGAPLSIDLDDYEVGLDLASANGQIYVCGTTGQPGFGSPRDFFVAKMNGAGELNATFGSGGAVITSIQVDFDDANAMTIQPDGKLVLAGFTSGFSTFTDNDVAVVRYFDDGSLATRNIEPAVGASVFPNPVIGSTVTVRTECKGMLRVALHDASGRLVRSLTEVNSTGTIALEIAGLPNGHYVVRLTDAGRTEQHALVIQR